LVDVFVDVCVFVFEFEEVFVMGLLFLIFIDELVFYLLL